MRIRGLKGDPEKSVEALLSIRRQVARRNEDEDAALWPRRIRSLHAQAPEEIARALEPFGFYRPEIESELLEEGNRWTATYQVDAGPPIRLAEVNVELLGEGSDEPGLRQAAAAFPLESGDVLNHGEYEAGKSLLAERALAEGYLDAWLSTHEIRIDLEAYSASIAVVFETGPQYFFGPVTFQQDFLDPELLEAVVPFAPGETFNNEKLLELQGNLTRMPYFQRVEVEPRKEQAEDLRVPIEVRLTEAKRQRYLLGAGFGTDTGVRGTIDADFRRLNRKGHRAELETELSELEVSLITRYEVPMTDYRNSLLTFSLGYEKSNLRTSDSQSLVTGASLTRSRGGWREAFSLFYRREDFEVGPDSGISNLLTPGASWTEVVTDDPTFPRHGRRLSLEVRGAVEELLSDSTFALVRGQFKQVHSLTDRIRLLGRAELGYLWTEDFRQLPPSIRFFAGGDQSVRGYDYRTLGPTAEGEVIGGEAMVTGSLEVDYRFRGHPWLDKFGVGAFYDVGNALDDSFGGDLEHGVGGGIRWLSPVGYVRLDVAFAVSEPDTPVRIHVSIGPDL